MNVSFFLARRLRSRAAGRNRSAGAPAIRIATWGIAIGLATMVVSVCVVLGFQQSIKEKVVGFGSDLEVMNMESLPGSSNPQPLTTSASFERLLKQFPGVAHAQRYGLTMGILKTERDFKGIQLKGVGPEYDTSFLQKHLVAGTLPGFSGKGSEAAQNVAISEKVANELGLKLGDRVYAYFFHQTLRVRRLRVSAIYNTHLEQFDGSVVFADLRMVQQLQGWEADQCSGYEIRLAASGTADKAQLQQYANQLTAQLKSAGGDEAGQPCAALSIVELYPQIFDWLSLLDMNVWIILILMVCLGGFTMVSGLLILILENTNTIGLLKAMGATGAQVRRVFLYIAFFVVGRGLVWGNLIGLGLCLVERYCPFIRLDAETYYVEYVPVQLNLWLIVALNVATLLITMLALIGPSFLVSRIEPARAIRYE